jgi:hypothetical protein
MLAVTPSHATMAVAGILAKANVGNHSQIRRVLFYLSDRVLNDAIFGVSPAGLLILRFRNPKEKDGLHPRFIGALCDGRDFFPGILADPGHARDLFGRFDFLAYKKWQNEIVPVQICFANEIANRRTAA